MAACEEMMMKKKMGSVPLAVSSSDPGDPLVCPKPRRVGLLNCTINNPMSLRWHFSHQADLCDSKAGADLLDIILSKGGEQKGTTQIASSSPYFSGSPPSRVSNPVILDARFMDDKLAPASSSSPPPIIASSPSAAAARKGGCVRANFGDKPAMRIEGFDCLDRDNRRNCTIAALA